MLLLAAAAWLYIRGCQCRSSWSPLLGVLSSGKTWLQPAPNIVSTLPSALSYLGNSLKGATKKLRDKDFAERSGELSGLVRFASKPLFKWVMTGNPLELFRKFFGALRAIFWLRESLLAPDQLLLQLCASRKLLECKSGLRWE